MLVRVSDRVTMMAFVKEARRMVKLFGWEDKVVHPYGFAEKVTKVLDRLADYDACTASDKGFLRDEANGLGNVLNAWAEYEACPKVAVRVIATGKVIMVPEKDVDALVAAGVFEVA